MRQIAALYVDKHGPYPELPAVDAWDKERDARLYEGPHPIVAHPPCGPWAMLRHLSENDEPELAERALVQVRRFGGVLEHPAYSQLWRAHRLPLPGELPDPWGFTIEVEQCEWGHVARKRTWLYLVGVPTSAVERPPFPGAEPTHWASGGREAVRGPVPPGIKVCSAEQRRRTPPEFAAYLVRLARASGMV